MEQWKQYSSSNWVSNFGNCLDNNKNPVTLKKIGNKNVSRIVFELFIGKIPEGCNIYHKDKNPLNNHIDNLEALKPKFDKIGKAKAAPFDVFLNKAKEVHGDKFSYHEEDYSGLSNKTRITCPTHGDFFQVCGDHCNGHGCSKCAKERLKTWTFEQDKFLTENYKNLGVAECSRVLKKTPAAVCSRAVYIGISEKTKIVLHPNIPTKIWSGILTRIQKFDESAKASLDFDIHYIWELYQKQEGKCALTGWDIVFDKVIENNTTVSVDRIDSKLGYLKYNIQLIHKDVNIMKNRFPEEVFYNVCEAVSNFRKDDYNPRVLTWEEDIWNDTEVPVFKDKSFLAISV